MTGGLTEQQIAELNAKPQRMNDESTMDLSVARISDILSRFYILLGTKYGVQLASDEINEIARQDTPAEAWDRLNEIVARHPRGSGQIASRIKEDIETFHVQESQIQYYVDPDRINYNPEWARDPRYSFVPDVPEDMRTEADKYRREHRELTDEGISNEEAHRILVEERGYRYPFVDEPNSDVVVLAQQLLVMQMARPDLLEEIDYGLIVGMDSVTKVREYLLDEELFTGNATEFQEFMVDVQELEAYEKLPEGLADNAQAATADKGNPTFQGDIPESQLVDVPPIGVWEGYSVTVEKPSYRWSPTESGYVTDGTYEVEKEPTYFQGMQFQEFAATQAAEVTLFKQSLLYDAGFLTQEQMTDEWGVGGTDTFDAMAEAMSLANQQGYDDWMAAATAHAQERESKAASDPDNNAGKYAEPVSVFTPEPYMKKDPDYLAQVVKQTFRNELGREPSAQEVASLIGQLGGEFRAQYEEQQRKARAEWEADIAARDATMVWDPNTGQYVPIGSDISSDEREEGESEEDFEERIKRGVDPAYAMAQDEIEAYRRKYGIDDPYPDGPWTPDQAAGGVAGGGGTMTMPTPYTGTEVDPVASFQEYFERYFADELSRNRARASSRAADAGVQASIMMLNQAIGGG